MQNADDDQRTAPNQIIDAEIIETCYRPRSQPSELWVDGMSWRARIRILQRGIDSGIYGNKKTICKIGPIQFQIMFVLPTHVDARGKLDEAFHLLFFADLRASTLLIASALRSVQKFSSIGIGSPEASPSSNSASRRASRSFSCASRYSVPKYSLMFP
jgi:hypothetical protein